jgi:hypothetical protein
MKTRMTLTGVFLIMISPFARAEWLFDGESSAFYNSNLSNSDRSADVKDDWAWVNDARAANAFQLSRDLRLNIAADLRSQIWDQYYEFNEIGSGVSVGLRYRFGLGRLAPWVLLENRVGYDDWFRETVRSGWSESLRFRGGIFLSDRIALEAGYRFDNFAAPDDFFDQQSHRADVRLSFDVSSALRVSLGYVYREGDVISYAVPPRPDIVWLAEAVREDEDTFGGHPPYNAYKLLGRTHALSVSAAYALTKRWSVGLSYEYAVTRHDPLQYENHLVQTRVAFAY